MRIECATSRKTVSVHNVKFSHRNVKRRFDDGRSLANLVEQLRRKKVHPLRDIFLRLRVWHFQGNLISRHNRRLYCLRKYQQERSENVMVMIDIVRLENKLRNWSARGHHATEHKASACEKTYQCFYFCFLTFVVCLYEQTSLTLNKLTVLVGLKTKKI